MTTRRIVNVMLMSADSAAEEIASIESDDPRAIRENAIETVEETVACDAVVFTKVVRDRGEYFYTAPIASGDSDVREGVRGYDGARAPIDPIWTPDTVEPSDRNVVGVKNFEPEMHPRSDYQLYREIYAGFHICHQLRLFLYQGRSFLGYLAVWRREEGPYSRDEIRMLNDLVEPLVARLGAAERRESSRLDGPADLLVAPEGPSIDYASETARDWLDAEGIELIEEVVGRAESRGTFPVRLYLAGREFRVACLTGALGVRYALTVESPELPELPPKADLTPRQREVAEYAAVGATAEEIADTLEISAATVRDHVRSIYDRLGIGSRAELARRIEV